MGLDQIQDLGHVSGDGFFNKRSLLSQSIMFCLVKSNIDYETRIT